MAHRGKVYVIDDDEAMRDSLDFLLGAADFDVTLFEFGPALPRCAPGVDFGCVVSDVRMPGIDGIELLKRMKASSSPFPVLVITGHGDVPLAVEAMKLGAVDFLEKPFEDDRLIGMIDICAETGRSRRAKRSRDAGHHRQGLEPQPQGTAGYGGAGCGALEQTDCEGI